MGANEKFTETPTLHIRGNEWTIDGSQVFSGHYNVCDERDVTLFLRSRESKVFCGAGPAEITEIDEKHGSFNKTSGQLELITAYQFHAEFQCKESQKRL